MAFGGRKAAALLFAGDILIFAFSLWLTLLLRYGAVPSSILYWTHLQVFGILFAVWALVFYMAGLYSKRVLLLQYELTGAIVRTQLLNITLAALFFFIVPGIGLAPKTNLGVYLVISLALVLVWRLQIVPRITKPGFRDRAAFIGSGPDAHELVAEVNKNPRYHLEFKVVMAPEQVINDLDGFAERLVKEKVTVLVMDTTAPNLGPLLPSIYGLAFLDRQYEFADLYRMYEEVFDRVPLSLLRYEWFLKNISLPSVGMYAAIKRAIDVLGGLLMGLATLLILPFVALALQFEYPGSVFITQMRMGRNGSRIKTYKFRSMRFGDRSAWEGEDENTVTRVGNVLRRTSLDEFPQFVNVLRGELSLIGPRNDVEALGRRLAEAIPYYNIRYVVKPGITGWAQINQQYEQGKLSPQSIEDTKVRLAYDFYYIKNRSLALDILIALRTIKRMLFRVSNW